MLPLAIYESASAAPQWTVRRTGRYRRAGLVLGRLDGPPDVVAGIDVAHGVLQLADAAPS